MSSEIHPSIISSGDCKKGKTTRIQIIEDCEDHFEIDDEIRRMHRKRASFISNPKLLDSMSSLDLDMQKRMVRLITFFSIMFFVLCFLMIAFTLRYSEIVDAKSKLNFTDFIKS